MIRVSFPAFICHISAAWHLVPAVATMHHMDIKYLQRDTSSGRPRRTHDGVRVRFTARVLRGPLARGPGPAPAPAPAPPH